MPLGTVLKKATVNTAETLKDATVKEGEAWAGAIGQSILGSLPSETMDPAEKAKIQKEDQERIAQLKRNIAIMEQSQTRQNQVNQAEKTQDLQQQRVEESQKKQIDLQQKQERDASIRAVSQAQRRTERGKISG